MKIEKKHVFILLLLVFSYLASYFKISFALGSYKFFFSGINAFAPLLGLFSSGVGLFLIPLFLIWKFTKAMTFGIPTLVATWCWASLPDEKVVLVNRKKHLMLKCFDFLLRVLLPLTAMLVFILHPVGRHAFLYSFYWLIPVVIYFVQKFKNRKKHLMLLNSETLNVFLSALSITFVSHAVGSIMWLYFVPLTAAQWLGLIPVVFVERLMFASGMSLVVRLLKVSLFSVSLRCNNIKCLFRSFGNGAISN